MPHLDELDFSVPALQAADEAVDPVAGVAENLAHAPRVQAFNEEIADRLRHLPSPKLEFSPEVIAGFGDGSVQTAVENRSVAMRRTSSGSRFHQSCERISTPIVPV